MKRIELDVLLCWKNGRGRFMIITLALALLLASQAAPATPQASESSPPAASQSEPANQPAAAKLPRPNPNASGKYHLGDGVSAPRVIYQEEPKLSREARKMRVNGTTVINLIVDTQGIPTNAHVIRSAADKVDEKHHAAALSLDQSALDAVNKYRFAPAMFNGKSVPLEVNIEVNMQLF